MCHANRSHDLRTNSTAISGDGMRARNFEGFWTLEGSAHLEPSRQPSIDQNDAELTAGVYREDASYQQVRIPQRVLAAPTGSVQ